MSSTETCAIPEGDLLIRTMAMPKDTNANGDIFGGWIMSQMDLAGAIYASYAVKRRLVTVAVESMNFHLPVFIGDQLSCYCDTTRIGNTSISIHIEAWVRRKHSDVELLKVTEATYTFVAINEDRKPIPIMRHKGD